MNTPYVTEYPSLHLNCLTAEQREHTVGYWYTITSGATAATAFRTREELLDWARDMGLEFAESVPAPNAGRGTHLAIHGAYQIAIHGLYRRALHRDVDAWHALSDVVAYRPTIDNGEYTVGAITADSDGHRTLHVINPNDRDGVFPFDRRRSTEADVADYIAATYN
ncbi:hypothetical protein [Gordonia malaquae]|uniref:hypothetical protein n=1 Tax=Gordonia malaquae TaxID=410332 RepID=UPI0030173F23